MTLYEISANMLMVSALMDQAETDEDIQVALDTMEALEGDLIFKAEDIIKVCKNIEADIQAIDEETKRLQDMKTSRKNKVDRLKKYLKENMESVGLQKIDTPLFKIAIQKNGGKQKIAYDVDIDRLPAEFTITTISPDTEAIRKVLDAGESDLFHYEERGTSLRIR